jgi:serine/threonine protein kinase
VSYGATGHIQELTGRALNERYLLRELLGSGGFGGVFLTEQHVLGRPVRNVACKVSRATGLTEQTAGSLFADILQLAGAMEGMTDAAARRHLVHVYDGGIARDLGHRAFLVMEYVPGRALAAEFTSFGDGRVPVRLLLKWVRQICIALRGLHGQTPPLLHRDLKPDNVLLGTDGTVRLIDFGLAARMLESGHSPGTAGTIQYMAPETAEGASVPASDIYSLGLVMYEGLTGRHAFQHLVPPVDLPSAQLGGWMQLHRRLSPPPRPAQLIPSLPRKLDDLVMGCLELRPASRVRTADQVIAAIDVLTEGQDRTAEGDDDLAQARRLRNGADLVRSANVAERALNRPNLGPRMRYQLLRELAETHLAAGAHAQAARRLAEAHAEAGHLNVGLTERCDLAAQAEHEFRLAANTYQAERFARIHRAERGR